MDDWYVGGVSIPRLSPRDSPEMARTPAEREFLEALLAELPDSMVYLHEDRDGTPWLLVAWDFSDPRDDRPRDTLRVDFDGEAVAGGFSPAFLNWDGGVRAADAEIDTDPPEGLTRRGRPQELAEAVIAWFYERAETWPGSERHGRWYRPRLPDCVMGGPDGIWYLPRT